MHDFCYILLQYGFSFVESFRVDATPKNDGLVWLRLLLFHVSYFPCLFGLSEGCFQSIYLIQRPKSCDRAT